MSFANINQQSEFRDYDPRFSEDSNFDYSNKFSSFSLTQDNRHKRVSSKDYYRNGNAGMMSKTIRACPSALMKEFFCDKNIKRLQKKMKREIYERSDGQFKMEVDQDKGEVLIIMEEIYTEHARNLPNGIKRQTKRLNQLFIDSVIPNMMTAIKQYYGYIKDISSPIEPIPRPMNVNNAGRQTLPSVTTIWMDRGYDDRGNDSDDLSIDI